MKHELISLLEDIECIDTTVEEEQIDKQLSDLSANTISCANDLISDNEVLKYEKDVLHDFVEDYINEKYEEHIREKNTVCSKCKDRYKKCKVNNDRVDDFLKAHESYYDTEDEFVEKIWKFPNYCRYKLELMVLKDKLINNDE